MITTLTTALATLAIFVDNRSPGRFIDFMVSPVRRWQLILGYLVQGYDLMSAGQLAELLGYIVLASAAHAARWSFLMVLVKSSRAFGALSIVVGTLIGFLAGAYLPVGMLSTGVVIS